MSWRFSAVVVLVFLLAAADAFAGADAPDLLAMHVRDLSSESADVRDKAEAALFAAGKSAVELLLPAALRGDLEDRYRATRILGRLANSPTDAAPSAQESLRKIAAVGDGPVSKQARDELAVFLRLEEMQQLAAGLALFSLADKDQPQKLALVTEPLLRFQDQERTHYDGTLWALGTPGRPGAFLCVYSRIDLATGGTAWASDLATIAPVRLSAENVDGVVGQNWTPRAAADAPLPFPGAEPAGPDADERLAQAKSLAARLTAREAWPPTAPPKELTLSPQPLLRYSDQEVADGIVFTFMHETNPEILILLEAKRKGDALVWHYQPVRQAAASLWLDLDGKELWVSPSPSVPSGGELPYWNFRRQPRK